jgi:predicted nucleotidyltransferase component of viral defense system
MDEVARWPARDRADLCAAVAGRRSGLRAEVIEKDFWACWALKRLFSLEAPPAGLIFKGGTSLSKVYGVIEQFSEDVDISFYREDLGFGGDKDPARARGKEARRRLDSLREACQAMIRERLVPLLNKTFSQILGTGPSPDT